MSSVIISDNIQYIGVDDKTIDLFESQYAVPNGVSYNSYVILDEKIAVMDTVDARRTAEWLENLEKALGGRKPDYLVISHLEPDHGGSIGAFLQKYGDVALVGNAKTFAMLPQFFGAAPNAAQLAVKEGDTLALGSHTLQFFMAPMVHWPEVMVEYEQTTKTLFSADAFGKFGALDTEEDWACEARRYYFNIVGKYGAQAAALLKKASSLEISTICPLHGPILKEGLPYYIGKYATWSSYEPEDKGILIACASIHGSTMKAALKFAELLREKGEKTVLVKDLAREDMSEVVEDAFRYDRLVLACATYDGGLFPCMEDFLSHLRAKNYQKRKAALMENGSWAPLANKKMRAFLEEMKEISVCENMVSIKSMVKPENIAQMEAVAQELLR